MERFQVFLGDARIDGIEIEGVGFKVLDKHEDDRGHRSGSWKNYAGRIWW